MQHEEKDEDARRLPYLTWTVRREIWETFSDLCVAYTFELFSSSLPSAQWVIHPPRPINMELIHQLAALKKASVPRSSTTAFPILCFKSRRSRQIYFGCQDIYLKKYTTKWSAWYRSTCNKVYNDTAKITKNIANGFIVITLRINVGASPCSWLVSCVYFPTSKFTLSKTFNASLERNF